MSEVVPESPHVGVILYTHDRVDDARINLEIIRNVWPENPLLTDVTVVHAFNGREDWWPAPYLENELVRTANPGHFSGAELLLNEGMRTFAEKYPEITHVIILASDTWCVKPDYIAGIIDEMAKKGLYLATCAWGNKRDTSMFKIGMSIDLCIVGARFAKDSGFFPLRYQEFCAKYGEVFMYEGKLVFLERVFALRFKQAVAKVESVPSDNLIEKAALAHVFHMQEREPVHYKTRESLFGRKIGKRQMYWPNMGLITHHDPMEKRRVFEKYRLSPGEYSKKFVAAEDLSYFNSGKKKTEYTKGGTRVNYND